MSTRLWGATIAAATATLVACGADNQTIPLDGAPAAGAGGGTFTYNDDTAWTTPDVARDVTVEETRLTLPRAYESWARGLAPRVVLASDRAPGGPQNNPMGFLRRIESVSVDGQQVVLTTSAASLQDLFAEADLSMDGEPVYDAQESKDDSQAQAGNDWSTGDLAPLDAPGAGSGGFTITPRFPFRTSDLRVALGGSMAASVRFEGSVSKRLQMRPSLRGQLQIHPGAAPDFSLSAHLPWSITDTVCTQISGELAHDQLEHTVHAMHKELPPLTYPGPPLGIVPTTVRIAVELSCGPYVTGSLQSTTTSTTQGSIDAELGIRGGHPYGSGTSHVNPTTVTRQVIIDGLAGFRCEIGLRFGLYLLGAAGAFVQPTLGAEIGASGQGRYQTGHAARGHTCVTGKLIEKLQVGISMPGFESSFAPFSHQLPLFPDACSTEGCSDRPDGWYCDTNSPNGGYRCANHFRAEGSACQTTQFCQVANAETHAAVMDGLQPRCGTAAPQHEAEETELACR